MAQPPEPDYHVDFPTLRVGLDWVENHCVIPDGFRRGEPFELLRWQTWSLANFYRVRPDAVWVPSNPVLAPAFHYRRSQIVGPQKIGKAPYTAAHVCLEGVGPALFAGWAEGGEVYDCRDYGCGCDWWYEYRPGEPMGMPWPTPLIQITAYSEEQPLALETPIATPKGWTTVGQVGVGDQVFDASGEPVTVRRTTSAIDGADCYAVTFTGGERIVASAFHGWTLERRTLHGDRRETVTVTTAELAATFRYSGSGVARYRTPTGIAWQLPHADLPVDPYLLGLWLGDGARGDATIACDSRLRGELAALVKPLLGEHETAVWRQGPGNQATMRIRRRPGLCRWGHEYGSDLLHRSCGPCRRREPRIWQCDSLRERLREVGVLGRKHIPTTYLRASETQRRSLLQGLVDSDGHVERNGRAGFTNADPVLVDGFTELLTSLGYRWTSRRDDSVQAWRVGFVPTADLPVARLAHKVDRHRPANRRRSSAWRHVESVERVESVPVRCLGIDTADHLFLVGRTAVPTHNTGNVYDALRPMIDMGPLGAVIPRTGEEFIRLPNHGRVDVVTSSAQSRLGQRVTFVPQDETGVWLEANKMVTVAETQRRGLAGMGGRAEETTNNYDPSENSVAQRTAESLKSWDPLHHPRERRAELAVGRDVFRLCPEAPGHLSYMDKRQRRTIHRYVYLDSLRDRGGHIDLDSIEAEASELLERDPTQAERFFGNRCKVGAGAWLKDGLWVAGESGREVQPGERICVGFDGSYSEDWTALRAETLDGFGFTPLFGPDQLPTLWDPHMHGERIPRSQVHTAVDEVFTRFRVVRMYCDPREWGTEIEGWALRYGSHRVFEWATNRVTQMHEALVRFVTDLATQQCTHDGCETTKLHVGNARKIPKPGERYILGKASEHQKIDAAMGGVLAHEARCDAVAAGARVAESRRRVVVLS